MPSFPSNLHIPNNRGSISHW